MTVIGKTAALTEEIREERAAVFAVLCRCVEEKLMRAEWLRKAVSARGKMPKKIGVVLKKAG